MSTDDFNDASLDLANQSNDDLNDLSSFKSHIKQLTDENDCYKQHIHSLQTKIQIESRIQNELQETIDNLEKEIKQLNNGINKRINDIEEKNGIARKELMSRLNEIEQESEQKSQKIEELKEKLSETNKLLSLATVEKHSQDSKISDQSESYDSQQINELLEKLLQEQNARRCLEETIETMNREETELKEILHITKLELIEKNKILEITRDELNECRIELDIEKNAPVNEMCKGNSLFAEVEDRRKKLLGCMAEMKKSYYDIKQCLNHKDNEIKALKTELTALLNKQKDDADECIQENGELIDKYKDRILELENKLSDQQKKYRKLEIQKQPADNTFSYFQSLLDTNRKEIEALEAKLENSSVQSLLQEEIKLKTNRQMRYWRNKAMSYEAQIETIQNRLENNHTSIDSKELLKICQRDCTTKSLPINESLMDFSEKSPTIIDESVLSLEELIKIPKVPIGNFGQEIKFDRKSILTSNNNISFGLSDHNDQSNKINLIQDSKTIMNKQINQQNCIEDQENEATAWANNRCNDNYNDNDNKTEKKVLKFAEGTVDPQSRKLYRQNVPKYPILYVSNNNTTDK